MARLTVKSVEAVQAADDRREIPDDYMRGLYFVVQPTGRSRGPCDFGKAAGHTSTPSAPTRLLV